jgi:ribosomal protein L19
LLYDSSNVIKTAAYETNFTSGDTVTPGVAFVESDKCRVTVFAYFRGVVIFTKSRYVTCTF